MNPDNKRTSERFEDECSSPHSADDDYFTYDGDTDVLEGKDLKHRDWNFTWNNYPEDYAEQLMSKLSKPRRTGGDCPMKYIIMGKEVCPTTGTPHIQGFVMFHNPRAFGKNMRVSGKPKADTLRGMFPKVSWHPVYTTPHKAAAYCRKADAEAIEYGERPLGQGERTDLHAVAAELLAGARPGEIAATHTAEYIKYGKGITMAYHDLHYHRDGRPHAVWLYGATGVGKSSVVSAKHGTDYYIKADGTQFWVGYDYQQAVILDEFTTIGQSSKGWIFESLLQVLDRHQLNIQMKGGHAPFSSPFIYITSPHPPDYHYPDKERLNQVLRRLDGVFEVISPQECRYEDKWNQQYYHPDREVVPSYTHPKLE